ncbi:hypothetical protein [Streptomyces sp. NPDC003720]|uniref:hypothetical protein n=1 Tax=Streptomyces sp. NPDC003720 TaxID=3364684 RepID=UPI0036B007DA
MVVGDVWFEDGPQALGVRVAQGDLVEQPVRVLPQFRHVSGQCLQRLPVLDEATAGLVDVLKPVEEFGHLPGGGDDQVLGGRGELPASSTSPARAKLRDSTVGGRKGA